MRRALPTLLAAAATGCADLRPGPEDPSSWYDDGDRLGVEEALAFTPEPYGLPAAGDEGLADALRGAFDFPRDFGTRVARDEAGGVGCDWTADGVLPVTFTGVATILPRYYFKTDGCLGGDEKYYASYFLEDDTGGVFVLGSGKVAWFDAGDTVTIRVRGTRRSFGLDMVYVHDVVDVQRTARPVHYDLVSGLTTDDIGRVRRVTGTVIEGADTFGEVPIRPDGATEPCGVRGDPGCVTVALDTELQRRSVGLDEGARVTVTGPVLFAYDVLKILVMRLGQVEAAEPGP